MEDLHYNRLCADDKDHRKIAHEVERCVEEMLRLGCPAEFLRIYFVRNGQTRGRLMLIAQGAKPEMPKHEPEISKG